MKINFKHSLAIVLLSLFTFSSHAADLTASVKERLAQPGVLRGDFEQNKQVSGFKKPLVSRGDFLVARDLGVLWRTKTPFASTLKLSRDEIVATQDGAVAFRLSASKEPSVRMINGLLFSLMNGDVSSLGELFKIEGGVNGKAWQLTLTPRQAALGKIMRKIELSGDQFVRRILLDEANGDQTAIHLSAQNTEPAKLSSEEHTRFE
ncbi:outer membrane lipoprotein carrier protein LolA [Iodobacter sp. HSC-16F04]|uniref:Outer membrane lipoprotein carrier protein LolA n=1 Tax=Iodobacter violaceini TaxID=3044271 RepID=A0ABX0KRV6_9NEIS|nr:outer membrane lipoprotein carrier protein LolA [Iodobacter violacea]NHQ85423.1 outer membrane lipoprotein carrier protein LolA [Iodobacter violacea]